MANDSNRFSSENEIKKTFDDPSSNPALPDGSGDGKSVGDKTFGKAHRYASGTYPDIAVNNNNVVVEVHQDGDDLRYRVGKVDDDKIAWSEKGHHYDLGDPPSVDINDNGLVVEVHKSQGLNATLWYRLGKVEGDKIAWRNENSIRYDSGEFPSVAINNKGIVVEVHQSQGDSLTLWYNIGHVEGDRIVWRNDGKSIEYESAYTPSVAITDDGLVVAAHHLEYPNYNVVQYRLGQIKGHTIDWFDGNRSHTHAIGANTSIAITNDRLIIEVHWAENLKYRLGRVRERTIDWFDKDRVKSYGDGSSPKVACNARFAVETHYTDKEDKLWSSVLTLPASHHHHPHHHHWHELHGENSYCRCACRSAGDNERKHDFHHTMKVKKGAPFLHATLTKNNHSIDFPDGAKLTVEGPDGTKYDHHIKEKDKLVVMHGDSVRCLIIKHPKPGDWKLTMTAPKGVGFHCECNTVPSKDVYDTITDTLSNSLEEMAVTQGDPVEFGVPAAYWGWAGIVLLGAMLLNIFTKLESLTDVSSEWMAESLDLDSRPVGKSGGKRPKKYSGKQRHSTGAGVAKTIGKKLKEGGKNKAAEFASDLAKSKKKGGDGRQVYAVAYNLRGDFIMCRKNRASYFYHRENADGGGDVYPEGSAIRHGGNDFALPGGGLEQGEPPLGGAQREFYEETNEFLDDWIMPEREHEGGRYLGVYFQLEQDELLSLFQRIRRNFRAGDLAAEAVRQHHYDENYRGLRNTFENAPHDNELGEAYLWNLEREWDTIRQWKDDGDKSWFYEILRDLRRRLGFGD
ncbi:NUDIX hydrolase [Nostocaceae cyanobacterium CENA369]|uniref:NUDIX hydrolase n=1 Tax=Dendronalium phyllosphericum CENA369 TaxID=1725256 RepID=A0A8J7LJD5_9NOST|nr:NUDIX hydrolase [Dendronalium phyllosphericum]MBH8577429.1 NUDIX hydrolase [Dendronalium phyllosphericum CENA369]